MGERREGSVLSPPTNSPTVQPPRNKAGGWSWHEKYKATIVHLPALLISPHLRSCAMWIKGLWKSRMEQKGIPVCHRRNLSPCSFCDIKENWAQSQYCHSSQSHNRRDNVNIWWYSNIICMLSFYSTLKTPVSLPSRLYGSANFSFHEWHLIWNNFHWRIE